MKRAFIESGWSNRLRSDLRVSLRLEKDLRLTHACSADEQTHVPEELWDCAGQTWVEDERKRQTGLCLENKHMVLFCAVQCRKIAFKMTWSTFTFIHLADAFIQMSHHFDSHIGIYTLIHIHIYIPHKHKCVIRKSVSLYFSA